MKFELTKIAERCRPKWLVLLGLFILVMAAPINGMLAQNSPAEDVIYLPLFNTFGVSNEGLLDGAAEDDPDASDSHDGHDHLPIGHIPENGRFTANSGGEMSWPPQVKYIKDVTWDGNAALVRSHQVSEANLMASAASDDGDVQALLGERYTFINSAPIQTKWDDTIFGYRVTYFSYSNNITIEAIVKDDAVESIETFSAAEKQPPLRKNEVDAAIEIARQYWVEQGNSRVNELQGFTIQTFRTEGEGGYYDTRMSYVSFHLDETSDPELLTWVDLTTETVVRAAVDNGGVQYEQ